MPLPSKTLPMGAYGVGFLLSVTDQITWVFECTPKRSQFWCC